MEGGSVELAAQVAAGHSLYVAPSLVFVGWTYTPLYYWISAALAKLIGIGFLALRLVSLTASLGSMLILGQIVARHTGDRIAGLLAAGLFAATFRISGAWFDTGRVDSLFLALTLLALALGATARSVRGGIALGALAFLAFLTKQTALLALLPALGVLAIGRRRAGIPALVTLAALLAGSTAALDAASHGWYGYYVVSELAHQPWARQEWVGFWRDDVLGHEWPLVLLVVLGGATAARRALRERRVAFPAAYHVAAAAGLLACAWVSRLHTGGYANVLMPAYAATALLAGLAYGALPRSGPGSRLAAAPAAALMLATLVVLAYPLGSQIPTAADRAAGAQLLARLRSLPGPVLVLRHPWYATLAGKGAFAQQEGIGDVLRSADQRGARALRASLRTVLDADGIQAVVLDGAFDAPLLGPELTREFRLEPRPITPSRLYPLTDVRTAPTLLYVRDGLR
jgi:4-amino-4-deoxy-L-arabinose transferase-like glycosyltransferase